MYIYIYIYMYMYIDMFSKQLCCKGFVYFFGGI